MNQPLHYQQELVEKAKVSNEEALEILMKAIENGHQATCMGTLSGPYMNYVTYWISDGTMVQMSKPAICIGLERV